ncbi:uncharacterized protein [Periplaneta americana]|uniref:uncharacterized protein n=1 Tax=Periplaneta americana TaxID=6978 RepID=UPI0037E82203
MHHSFTNEVLQDVKKVTENNSGLKSPTSVADIKETLTNKKTVRFQLSVKEDKTALEPSSKSADKDTVTNKLAPEAQDSALQKSLQEHHDRCLEAMKIFPYFSALDNDQLKECCNLSKLEKYGPQETILGDGRGKINFVYFILNGQCRVIEHMELAGHENNGRNRFRLHSEDMPLGVNEHLQVYFMQVCLLEKAGCFAIGENLKDRSVIAVTEVECLLCSRHWLMKHSKANIWQRIVNFLNAHLPSKEDIFTEFLVQRKWLKYRHNLVKNILIKNDIKRTSSFHNVPYSVRIMDGVKLYNE